MAYLVPSPSVPNSGAAAGGQCWNKIGVRGDQSCEQLPQHIHCRNCPVYTAVASDLLDRPVPEAYVQEATRHFAQPKLAVEQRTESVVIFRLGGEWLGLPTASVAEVATVRPFHSLPHRRNRAVLGIANIRGELLVGVSLARLLGVEDAAAKPAVSTSTARLLVLQDAGTRIVSPVDEVHGVHRFDPAETQEVPASVARALGSHTRTLFRWQERAVGCLDPQRLMQTVNRSLG